MVASIWWWWKCRLTGFIYPPCIFREVACCWSEVLNFCYCWWYHRHSSQCQISCQAIQLLEADKFGIPTNLFNVHVSDLKLNPIWSTHSSVNSALCTLYLIISHRKSEDTRMKIQLYTRRSDSHRPKQHDFWNKNRHESNCILTNAEDWDFWHTKCSIEHP